jgi:predicted transcriptional regulator
MTNLLPRGFSRRERQIMQILYQQGQASVSEVLEGLPDPPSYSAIRRLLAILEEKGQVTHAEVEGRYVYSPAQSWNAVSKSALQQVMETFFGGSVEQVVTTLLSGNETQLTDSQISRLTKLIESARAEEEGNETT